MPLDIAVPTWYNDDSYINEKVDECNTIKFGAVEGEEFTPWTAASVRDFLAAANGEADYQPWMGYANFVSNGNAENCSPSPYFVVAEYLAAKAAQLNNIKFNDKTDWNQQDVLKAFDEAGISAWDHYTTSGQAEDINPSNAFDNSAFFEAKCEILNNWENEDGTTGYEGKNDWTPEDVIATFQSLGINPIMNQPENPNAASLVIAVPGDEQVQDNGFNVWNPTGVIDYVDVPVTTDPLANVGTAANENFIADVTTSSKTTTLLKDTTIDGDGGQDMLTVNMSANFRGFANENALTNVEDVVLNNTTKSAHSFNAQNTDGVETWTLNEGTGPINLVNLPTTGVTVNVVDLDGGKTTNIGFGKDVAAGTSDAMTIGLDNAGTPKIGNTAANYAQIKMAGIENVTLDATGDNYVNLANVSDVENLVVTGKGDLTIDSKAGAAVANTLETLDASGATGNIKADLANASMVESIATGSGNDTVIVSKIQETAPVDGGDGNDTLVLSGLAEQNFRLQMNDVETLSIENATGDIILSGSDTSGLETLKVKDLDTTVTMGQYDNASLTIQAVGDNKGAGAVEIGDIEEITLNVGDGDDTKDSFKGTLTLADATNLTVNVEGPSANTPAAFSGAIDAKELTDLTINNGHNAQPFILASGTELDKVSQINVQGFSNVDLRGDSQIGSEAGNLAVDATNLNAEFKANFTTTEENSSLMVEGSTLQANTISVTGSGTVDSNYSTVSVTGGLGDDVLFLNGNGTNAELTGDLGMGNNKIFVLDPSWNITADDAAKMNASLGTAGPSWTGTDVEYNAATIGLTGATPDITINGQDTPGQVIDLNNLYIADTATSLTATINAGTGDTVVLGTATGDNVAENATVVLGFDSSAANLNVVIDNFNSDGTDQISFDASGFLSAAAWDASLDYNSANTHDASGATATASNESIQASYSMSVGHTLADDKIYALDGVSASDVNAVAALFADASQITISNSAPSANDSGSATAEAPSATMADLFLNTGSGAMLAIADGEGNTNLWYIDNASTDGVAASEVFLIGTLTGVGVDAINAAVFGS